jgi:hypothetical protein
MRWLAGNLDASVDGRTDERLIVEFCLVACGREVGNCPNRDSAPAKALRRRMFGSFNTGMLGVIDGKKIHSARVRHK